MVLIAAGSPMPGSWLTIGELANRLDVTVKVINQWEKQGLISSQRSPGGHRRYNLEEVQSDLKPKGDHPRIVRLAS